MTITIPPDLEGPLKLAASQQGATPELLAVESLRRLYSPPPAPAFASSSDTFSDFLAGYVGTVAGAAEAFSEDTGRRLTELLHQERSGEPS